MRQIMCGMAMVLAVCAGPAEVGVAQESATSVSQPAPSDSSDPIDLNQATAAELESLPGVGPRTSERIIEYRRDNDGFKKIEELMNIRGIGERSFLRLRPLVTVTLPEPAVETRR